MRGRVREADLRGGYTKGADWADNIVIPRVFAAGDDLVYVPHLGHLGMLFSPSVFGAVASRLLP